MDEQTHYSKQEFEIKDPKWALWVCLIGMIGCLIAFLAILYLENQNMISSEILTVGYFSLFFSFLCAIGIYVWFYNKLTYSNGVYTYYNPFGKNKTAKVGQIAFVAIEPDVSYGKFGRGKNKQIFFYDEEDNVLIKMNDDGAISENEAFLQSLVYNNIELIRIESDDY